MKIKPKILLIEDENDHDKLLTQLYERALKFQGFQVERVEKKSFEEVKKRKTRLPLINFT